MNTNYYSIYTLFFLKEKSKLKILKKWKRHIENTGDLSFETGLIGYGWTLAYLSKKNRDFIDQTVDDIIYRLLLSQLNKRDKDIQGLIHFIMYLYQQLKSPNNNIYQSLIYSKCLNHILLEFKNFLIFNISQSDNIFINKIEDIIDILSIYIYMYNSNIDVSILEDLFYTSTEQLLERLIETNLKVENKTNSLFQLFISIKHHNNKYWESKMKKVICDKQLLVDNSPLSIWKQITINIIKHGNYNHKRITMFNYNKKDIFNLYNKVIM